MAKSLDTLPRVVALLIETAAIACGVAPVDVLRGGRKAPFVRARHAIMYTLRHHDKPLSEIARHFEMDHASVSHAVRSIKHLRVNNKPKDVKLEELLRTLNTICNNDRTAMSERHGAGYSGEATVVRYIRQVDIADMEWCFKVGVRLDDGYMIPLKAVKDLPIGPLSVIVEYERPHYDYMHIQTMRKAHGPSVGH